jgi:ribosome-associated toxin RatA of RatAB toxin-antitoxin module
VKALDSDLRRPGLRAAVLDERASRHAFRLRVSEEGSGLRAQSSASKASQKQGASNQTTLWLVADQTSASINIAAKPDVVMAVICDFERYPDWVDSMKSAAVLTSLDGKAKTVRMVLDHTLVKDNYVLAYDWKPRAVSWQLIEGNLLKAMDGSYVLKPNGAGTTVTYTLTVDINLPMIGMFKRKAEKTIIDSALKGLKRRVEG